MLDEFKCIGKIEKKIVSIDIKFKRAYYFLYELTN